MNTNLFDKQSQYFIIDSDNIETVCSHMYGVCIINGHLITSADMIDNPSLSKRGSYIYIKREKDSIEIHQDFLGSYGLFYYLNDDYFALSNNFIALVDHLKNEHPLTFNESYSDLYLIYSNKVYNHYETLIKEIVLLDRHMLVHIDIPKKQVEFEFIHSLERDIPLYSSDGLRILDQWYEEWVEIVFNAQKEYPGLIRLKLSGGFDSRMVLTLLLHPQIDRRTILFFSKNDSLRNHSEDFQIAREIADLYNLSLNDPHLLSGEKRNLSIHDMVARTTYTNFCFHSRFLYDVKSVSNYPEILLGGYGGEAHNNRYQRISTIDFLKDLHNDANGLYGDRQPGRHASALRSAIRSLQRLDHHYSDSTLRDHINILRCLSVETFMRQNFALSLKEEHTHILSPLSDPLLYRLDTTETSIPDLRLLAALVYTRYAPDLLNVPMEGGRYISLEAKEKAKILCKKYPYHHKTIRYSSPSDSVLKQMSANRYPPSKWAEAKDNPFIQGSEIDEVFNHAFLSSTIRSAFVSVYGNHVYEKILKKPEKIDWIPYAYWHSALAVSLMILYSEKKDPRILNMDMPDYIFALAEESESGDGG